MNPHQLNRIATFLDMLNKADRDGVQLQSYYGIRLVVDGEETGLLLGRANDEYIVMPEADQ